MLRYQRLDAHLERLRKRVTEYLGGSPVPQEYLLGRSISDDDRVPYPLEELADAQILRLHVLRSTPHQETPNSSGPSCSSSYQQHNEYPQNPTRASQMGCFRAPSAGRHHDGRRKIPQHSPTKPQYDYIVICSLQISTKSF